MSFFKTFGSNPSGNSLERILASANYRDRIFHNLSETRTLIKGASFLKITWKFFNKPRNTVPARVLPSVKTPLEPVAGDTAIIWFGHSSYFIHTGGKNILVDPVFSGYASPFSFTTRSFKGTDIYTTDDLPPIDILILTHDHYDHLDYHTMLRLRSKTRMICTSLGVGAHLRYWGFDPEMIREFDWWESLQFADSIRLTAAPARHFSGRSFTRNKTLWSSFILESKTHKIYIGSDSGYDSHFSKIGELFGPFDIALLEAGQYNLNWPHIHMLPEETVQAAIDLRANVLMPVHWGKFSLSLHPWNEPVKRVVAKAAEMNVAVTTPMIGQPVVPGHTYPNERWWEDA